MFEGLIGAIIAIGILCIVVWIVVTIVQHVGVPVPSIVWTIVWGVVGIFCLILLARGIGVAIPGI